MPVQLRRRTPECVFRCSEFRPAARQSRSFWSQLDAAFRQAVYLSLVNEDGLVHRDCVALGLNGGHVLLEGGYAGLS